MTLPIELLTKSREDVRRRDAETEAKKNRAKAEENASKAVEAGQTLARYLDFFGIEIAPRASDYALIDGYRFSVGGDHSNLNLLDFVVYIDSPEGAHQRFRVERQPEDGDWTIHRAQLAAALEELQRQDRHRIALRKKELRAAFSKIVFSWVAYTVQTIRNQCVEITEHLPADSECLTYADYQLLIAFNHGDLVVTLKTGQEVLRDFGTGQRPETFRPGNWIDYIANLHQQIIQRVETERVNQERLHQERDADRFAPIDLPLLGERTVPFAAAESVTLAWGNRNQPTPDDVGTHGCASDSDDDEPLSLSAAERHLILGLRALGFVEVL